MEEITMKFCICLVIMLRYLTHEGDNLLDMQLGLKKLMHTQF